MAVLSKPKLLWSRYRNIRRSLNWLRNTNLLPLNSANERLNFCLMRKWSLASCTNEEYVKTIKEFEDIRISMDGKGRAIDNVWIERFFRTLKHEHVYLQPSNNGHDLHRSIKTFVHYYNNQRKHSSLQYRTPASVYHTQVTGEQNDNTMGNQPDGAKLSYAMV